MEIKVSNKEDPSFVSDVVWLDSQVYREEHQGSSESVTARFMANPESYILAYDGDRLIGYFCFFPITPEVRSRMFVLGSIFDDNIEPSDIMPYSTHKNDIFIISCVIHPDYQDSDVVMGMQREFALFLRNKIKSGYPINSMSGITVSTDGEKLAGRMGLIPCQSLSVGYILYSTNNGGMLKFISEFADISDLGPSSVESTVESLLLLDDVEILGKFGKDDLCAFYSMILGTNPPDDIKILLSELREHFKELRRKETLAKLSVF